MLRACKRTAVAGMGEWWDPASPVHFRGRAISLKAPRPRTGQRAPLSLSNTTGDGPLGDWSPPRRSSDYIRVAEKSTSPVHFRGRAISPKAPRPQSRNALEMGPYPGSPRATSGEPKTNSAGPGLRSLMRLWRGGAFALCARGDGDRLQGSLQPDPAPLGVLWRYAGSGLRSLMRLWEGLGFRALREG